MALGPPETRGISKDLNAGTVSNVGGAHKHTLDNTYSRQLSGSTGTQSHGAVGNPDAPNKSST